MFHTLTCTQFILLVRNHGFDICITCEVNVNFMCFFHIVCTYVYMFLRGPRGRIDNVAKSVTIVKYCINKKNK